MYVYKKNWKEYWVKNIVVVNMDIGYLYNSGYSYSNNTLLNFSGFEIFDPLVPGCSWPLFVSCMSFGSRISKYGVGHYRYLQMRGHTTLIGIPIFGLPSICEHWGPNYCDMCSQMPLGRIFGIRRKEQQVVWPNLLTESALILAHFYWIFYFFRY